jgi:hypothetical protein
MGKGSRPRFKPKTYLAASRRVTEPYHTVVLLDGGSDAVQMFMHLKYVWGMSCARTKGLVKDLKMACQEVLNRYSLKTFNCHNLLCVPPPGPPADLKVVYNEKQGGFGRWLLWGIDLDRGLLSFNFAVVFLQRISFSTKYRLIL